MKKENDDLWEIGKILLFAAIVTWIPFSIFEIHQPYVEKQLRYISACEKKGGFVYKQQNEETKCISKDHIIIIP